MDIALVQDYHISNGSFSGLPVTWPFYQSKLKTAGIIIANPLFVHVQTLQKDNSVFINLTTKIEILKFGSQYTKPSGNLEFDMEDWSQSMHLCNTLILGVTLMRTYERGVTRGIMLKVIFY